MSRFRSLLMDAVTPADLKAIVKAQVAKAKKGDARAAQLILSYTAGAPLPPAIALSIEQAATVQHIIITDETSGAAPGDRHTVIEVDADGRQRVLRDPPDRCTIIVHGDE